VSFLASDCARARESVSVQLDGELPELELDRLETHLRICPECSAWAEQIRDLTQQLRGAALEEPQETFALPRRSPRWAVSGAVALASAAAVVATMFIATPGRQHAALGSTHFVKLRAPAAERAATPRLGRLGDGLSLAAFSPPRPASSHPAPVAF
jgi:predicted anti-sigma-YlaC factor YlaD